jgi:hypothetical protein
VEQCANDTVIGVPEVPVPVDDIINISGTKTDSSTGDPLAGWTITLANLAGTTWSTITDAAGSYSFTGLPLDTYAVYETIQAGWECITPDASGRYDGITAAPGSGTTDVVRNFANYIAVPPPPVVPDIINIRGTKKNEKGVVLAGWTITLAHSDRSTHTTKTDAQGKYAFTGLPLDTYSVHETIQAGWVCITPDSTGRYSDITAAPGSGTTNFTRNFVNNRPVTVAHQSVDADVLLQTPASKNLSASERLAAKHEYELAASAVLYCDIQTTLGAQLPLMGEVQKLPWADIALKDSHPSNCDAYVVMLAEHRFDLAADIRLAYGRYPLDADICIVTPAPVCLSAYMLLLPDSASEITTDLEKYYIQKFRINAEPRSYKEYNSKTDKEVIP